MSRVSGEGRYERHTISVGVFNSTYSVTQPSVCVDVEGKLPCNLHAAAIIRNSLSLSLCLVLS